MDKFGEYLREQREKKAIRLEEIASITKINLHNLELLEAGRLEKLPPEPFLRGFIIAYAKYIGLDPKAAIEKYVEYTGAQPPTTLVLNETLSSSSVPSGQPPQSTLANPSKMIERSNTHSLRKGILFASILVFIGVVAVLIQLGQRTPQIAAPLGKIANVETPPMPDPKSSSVPEPIKKVEQPPSEAREVASIGSRVEMKSAEEVNPPSTVTPPPETVAKPPHEIQVEARDRTWMKVVTDDKSPLQSILKPGEKVVFAANDKIKVVLGNASVATVTHNGQITEGKQYLGTIRYYIFPVGSRFPQDRPSTKSTDEKSANPAAARDISNSAEVD